MTKYSDLGGFLLQNIDEMPRDEFNEAFNKYAEHVLGLARKKASANDDEMKLDKDGDRMSEFYGRE